MSVNEYRIIIAAKAHSDMLNISTYISDTLLSPETSKQFIKGLKESISNLSFTPYRFPLIQNSYLEDTSIHCMPYKNHYIFYQIDDDNLTVHVVRIGYNKRNWQKVFTP